MPRIAIVHDGVPQFDLWTVCLGADGRERPDADGEAPSGRSAPKRLSLVLERHIVEERAAGRPYTDVVVMTHGWLSTERGADTTFTAWADAAARALETHRPRRAFRPLVIGIHWPSAPTPMRLQRRLATPPVPFETDPGEPDVHPDFLDLVSHLVPWASFYTMKARAERVGRRGGARLIARLQTAASGPGTTTAFHLVGHSFGCKLLAEALANGRHRVDPVQTLFLVQGAFSAWGFAGGNAYDGAPGSVRGIIANVDVRGVLAATTTRFDYALGRMFPGAELIDLVVTLLRRPWRWRRGTWTLTKPGCVPRLAALGHAGFAGLDDVVTKPVVSAGNESPTALGLMAGGRYRLDCDAVLTTGPAPDPADPDGPERTFHEAFVGAHSNLLHPELAAAFWEAAFAAETPAEPTEPYAGPRIPSTARRSLNASDRQSAGGSTSTR